MLRALSTPLPHFRGNCEQQVRILFLSDRVAAWHMTSHTHTDTTHSQTQHVCPNTHTHTLFHAVCIYLGDELILSD